MPLSHTGRCWAQQSVSFVPAWLTIWALVSSLDLWTTWFALMNTTDHELSPVGRLLVTGGLWRLIAAKIVVTLGLVTMIRLWHWSQWLNRAVCWGTATLVGLAAYWNLYQLARGGWL